MKKILWLVLILLLLCAFVFSACDNVDQPQSSTDTPTGTTDNATESNPDTHIHAFGEWIIVKEATCTVNGEQERSCSCGENEKQSINAFGHTEVIDATVAATCTTDGKTEGKHCSVCNTVTIAQTTIKAKGHTEVTDKAVTATCTTDGKTEGKHCSVCNTVTIAQTTVKAKGHSYVNDICENCNTLIDKQGAIEAENKRHSDFVTSCQEGINVHSQEANRLKQAYGISTVSNDAAYYRGLQKEIDTNITNITNNINHYKGLESLYGTDYSSMIATFESNLRKEKERKTLNERYLAIAIQQDEVEAYRNKLAEEEVRHSENLRLINARYYCIENGHTNIVIDQARPATCGRVGLSQGSHCADCNTIIQEQIVSPITGHDYGSDNKCIFCGSPKPSDGLCYTLRSDGVSYSVSIGSCTDRVVVIADTYNGLPVVEIAEKAFYKSIILSIVIPENVTIIGDYAFFRCESLKEITLPSTLENIGNMVFYYCALLKNVTYNGTVEEWNSITKVSGWDSGMGNTPLKKYTVYCTDETLTV